MPEWEAEVLRFFNSWPDWLKPMMWVLQQPGIEKGLVKQRVQRERPYVALLLNLWVIFGLGGRVGGCRVRAS